MQKNKQQIFSQLELAKATQLFQNAPLNIRCRRKKRFSTLGQPRFNCVGVFESCCLSYVTDFVTVSFPYRLYLG